MSDRETALSSVTERLSASEHKVVSLSTQLQQSGNQVSAEVSDMQQKLQEAERHTQQLEQV